MTKTLVLDASAAIRLVVGPTPLSIETALQQASNVIAPGLFASEAANTLWKYVKAGVFSIDDAIIRLQVALELCDQLLPDEASQTTGTTLIEALSEACRLNHPVYDLIYLVTTRRHAATLVTCDQRLASLATGQGLPVILE